MTGETPSPEGLVRLRIAGWEVDPPAHQLSRDDERRHLEPRVMALLLRLADQPHTVVTRTDLLTDVWGDVYVGDDALSAAVIKLRKAFGDDPRAPRVIETVPKSGYRLIADVRHLSAAEQTGVGTAETSVAVRHGTVLRCAVELRAVHGRVAGAESWQSAMRDTVDHITRIAESHGGVVTAESSAVVAVFGAPTAQEHHLGRAVRAAVDLRSLAGGQTLNTPDLEVRLRFGIASGPLVATESTGGGPGVVFGEPTMQATVLADTAESGEVLLTAESVHLSHDTLDVQPRESPPALAELAIFRLRSTQQPGRTRQADGRQSLTSLCGRSHEMEQVERIIDLVDSGRGQLLALSGEPGVGKSRLLDELLERASTRGFTLNVGSASPFDRGSPYFPLQSMLRDSLSVRHQTVGVANVRDFTALNAILEPSQQDEVWLGTDPDVRQARIVTAVLEELVPDDSPTVLAIEDCHWADEATRSLIGAVADRIARRRCLLVVSHRPEFSDPWSAKSYATRIRVDSLDQAASSAMLDELVGVDPSLAQWKQRVLDRAGGTPLFLEESVRAAEALGDLTGVRGQCVLRRNAASLSVPPSVQGLLAERIDRLPSRARSVLSVAAVIGREVPAALLHAMSAADDAEFGSLLGQLQAAELLYEARTHRPPAYLFNHAFTQEVAYLGIPSDVRRGYHQRIAELLQGELAEMVPTTAELLAWHLEEAGLAGQALVEWRRAAVAASEAGAFTDALAHLERARRLLDAVADDSVRLDHELGIELATGTALVQTVGPTAETVAEAYARARDLAWVTGSAEQKFEALWGAWFVNLMRGHLHIERDLGDQVFALAETLDNDALALEAHHVQWSGLTLAGRPAEVVAHSEIGIERYRAAAHHRLTFSFGGHDPGVCARNLNAMARWLMGDLDTARTRAAAAIELAAELGHPYSQLEACHTALTMALVEHDADELERHAINLQAMVDDGRLPDVAAGYAQGYLGAAAGARGDHESALRLMSAAAPIWYEFWGAWCFPLDTALAEELATAGRVADAIVLVTDKLAWARESGGHWWNAEFLRVLAELSLRDGADVNKVEAMLVEACEVARSQGSLLLEQRAAASLAKLPA